MGGNNASKRDLDGLSKKVNALEKSLATAVAKLEKLTEHNLEVNDKREDESTPTLTAEEVHRIVGEAVATSAAPAPQAAAVEVTNPPGSSRGIYTTLQELTANTKRVDSLIVEYVP